jgi:hypothetical protein
VRVPSPVVILLASIAMALVFPFAGCGHIADIHDTQEGKSNTCVTCHRAAYEATTKPKHLGLFPETCNECHSTKGWVPTTADFHEAPALKSQACVTCHKAKYDQTTKPKHAGLFPETCQECHSTKAWAPTAVDFHEAPALKSQACVTCHKAKYDQTTKPKHSPRLPETCNDCHATKGWVPLPRNLHESETARTTLCATCHIDQFNAVTNPKHVGIFPTQCAGCHGTTAWKPAINVSHDWFPLQNKHAAQPCLSCHTKGFQSGITPNTCVGCHQKDYDAAANPSHVGFPTDCKRCHNDAGWKPFFHGWPLTGKHTTTACAGCHTGNPPVYVGTPTTCVGCHLAAYNASPYPGHQTFSKTCTDCHTTTAFKPAISGGHPEAKFPIANGTHSIFQCVDCHNPALGASTGGANTDCIGCHTGQHKRSSMDAKHSGVRNYPPGPAAPNFCLACHPNGRR